MLMASYVASMLGHGDSGPVFVEDGLVIGALDINDLRGSGYRCQTCPTDRQWITWGMYKYVDS